MRLNKWLTRVMFTYLSGSILCGCTMVASPEEWHIHIALTGLPFAAPTLVLLIRYTRKGWSRTQGEE